MIAPFIHPLLQKRFDARIQGNGAVEQRVATMSISADIDQVAVALVTR